MFGNYAKTNDCSGLSQEASVMQEAGKNDAMIYGIYRKLSTDYSNHTKRVIQPLLLPQWLPNGCSLKKRRWEESLSILFPVYCLILLCHTSDVLWCI